MILYLRFLLLIIFLPTALISDAQIKTPKPGKEGIYVDGEGTIRWKNNGKEAAFFGVNYTAPFAYGYRAIKRLHINVEQAIKDDVYHFSRLGLDAFRVHVWDTELSDSTGNLINNEHLRLFDFLIAELKKRGIKTLVTPIAFWGNGYPEKDEDRGGFSSKYGKDKAVIAEAAIKAQENYLKQFFKHKNKYTGFTYEEDPDVIATEVNNEPKHTGLKKQTTAYINRMVTAIRSTGWSKPIFYNISESPDHADAVVKANVQGHSFQWYPTGLVSGHTLKGNYLPHVANYFIPFDTIPNFKNRAKMVYEFDAADVLASYLYPAMAKSFRMAGFQWATQFAYDPMSTAYANTEYQTHYLNLAYTPSKAISLLIASKVFHQLPRLKSKDIEPTDTLFDAFRVSYKSSLSEMNTEEAFFYSNSTGSKPVKNSALRHIAGVGTSPVVFYEGSGAYFIDKLDEGVWRLEVMPDAAQIADPFGKTSIDREVTHISWQSRKFSLKLPDLGNEFSIKGVNKGNKYSTESSQGAFAVLPGTYLIVKKGNQSSLTASDKMDAIEIGDFVAPIEPFAALSEKSILEIFDPNMDKETINLYNPEWKSNSIQYVSSEKPLELLLKMTMNPIGKERLMGFQSYFGDKLKVKASLLSDVPHLYLRARTGMADSVNIKVGLITNDAGFYSSKVSVGKEFRDIKIPLNSLNPDAKLLLPRPYPDFQPLTYKVASKRPFNISDVENIEVTLGDQLNDGQLNKLYNLEIESIYLK